MTKLTTRLSLPPHNWSVESYWMLWRNKRDQVTGNFAGTTTEIIQWAACKWGVDEDTIRAAAVQESYWHMNTLGDVCGPQGEARARKIQNYSFGSEIYALQELVSPAPPEFWLTTSAFEVLTSRG